jgi:D-tyrosyl-tRNA(Tyr) deacylase
MIALIQRVTRAEVRVGERILGAIELGIAALVGVRRADDASDADRLIERVLGYRIFPDPAGRMNLDLGSVGGGLLLIPQFTLAADTARGMRPGFSTAAAPEQARALFDYLVRRSSERHRPVASGAFGAHMQLSLINDGPVTFWLET